MRAILIDTYRHKDKVVIWLKTPDENFRLVKTFNVKIYLEFSKLAERIIAEYDVPYKIITKRSYLGDKKKVYEVNIQKISNYEKIIRKIERKTKHRLVMYNADIPPEQLFLYNNNLKPFTLVEVHDKIIPLKEEVAIPLEKIKITVIPCRDIRASTNTPVKKIIVNDKETLGDELQILKEFSKIFIAKDPDVILMNNAFSKLPYLVKRLELNKIKCPFHRWDHTEIKHKGGKSFFSYGRVIYRDYAIRLKGRFLVDSDTTIGQECNIDGIIELSNLSGQRFQQVASRSFGAVFQSSLVRELVKKDYLVPFKEKPVDKPISLYHLLKFDRVGHTFDAITGLHHNVAEIDFSSLFPWIIYNYNISTETLLRGKPPYQQVPGLPLKISLRNKGVVASAIKPLLDRRMCYKKNPNALNKEKLQGLKWVLVTSYGYLRFREFKLGMATSHMAIGSFAREIMLKAKNICEEHGFKIVHGIIDSLYIQKKNITEKEVKEICREIELETGIPVSFEGIFKWIVFLPSVNDDKRPVPSHYYGVYQNGNIKVRGLEVRESGTPRIVKYYQSQVLQIISQCNNKAEIMAKFNYLCQLLRKTLFMLPNLNAEMLSCFIRISKTDYKNNIPQKIAISLLRKKGISVLPGQKVYYIFGKNGIVLPEDYDKPDIEHYKKLLVRSLFIVLQPFGFTKQEINKLTENERQTKLAEYCETYLYTHAEKIQISQRTS